MFFPENFPAVLMPELTRFLLEIQKRWQEIKPKTLNQTKEIFLNVLSLKKFSFPGFPPYWWLRFILYRQEKLFLPEFVAFLDKFLIKTKVRSFSGIIPVAVFTKPIGCPFHCVYCPEAKNLPKSYLKEEPAMKRAIREKFDPYFQTRNRLITLALSGHKIDKVEIIIKGGTFSSYSPKYRQKFIKEVFVAANTDIFQILKTGNGEILKNKTLSQAQKINEKARCRIVGINIETRPDTINLQEINFLRKLGVTHVELGVQILDEKILKKLNRHQTIAQVKKATFLLKEAGFKVSYHLMPNLPFSSPQKDLKTCKRIFNPSFSPDHLKIYPTVIAKKSQLALWYKKKIYQPYSLKN